MTAEDKKRHEGTWANVYQFTGDSDNGFFQFVAPFLRDGHSQNAEQWQEVDKGLVGIKYRTHDFVKDWTTGDFRLRGEKLEWGGANGKGYALMVNGQFYKDGDRLLFVGGFSIL